TLYTLTRNLSADGSRVFFETTEALVTEDINGDEGCPIVGPAQGLYPICLDVYEWEAKGKGSCETEAQNGGCLYLLSTGKSPDASYIADASTSGDDVFLITRSALVRQDQDELYDVYDAHLGGGLAGQNEVHTTCASIEGCRSQPPPSPPLQDPGTASFQGPANPKGHRHKKRHKGKKRRAHKGKHHSGGRGAARAGRGTSR
ncbi:MAG TPA: hypothetical protein VN733_03630, partial [Solirubrobacterales bacterium]|nr:hypothetical protein [Solirubrobacterales bacterium]